MTARDQITWSAFNEMALLIQARISPDVATHYWDYVHPPALQITTPERLRKPRRVRASYTRFGPEASEAVICLGGIANVARRFDRLATHLSRDHQIVAMDWLGRGRSGWLPEQGDYHVETLIEQVLQLIGHLGLVRVAFVGSSLGGSVAMAIAASCPDLVHALVLNDIGPFIPAKRRSRRAESVARHYVFRQPIDLFTRSGAAQKHDGPVDDATLLINCFHQTTWSDEEDGRIYRHDPRALAAYRSVAGEDHDQWQDWHRLRCPVLVVHGLCSDALLPETVDRMVQSHKCDVLRVPDTGHTPTLTDPALLNGVASWLRHPEGEGTDRTLAAIDPPRRVLFTTDLPFKPKKTLENCA
ncbi:MAG: alpha/beta fold hydrolase [Geminicoccaceae bacterium]